MTFTLTTDQILRMEALRKTTIAGNAQDDPKTPEQVVYQIIDTGLAALDQRRKQYSRQRQAMKIAYGK
jgi:hypothetical protein